MCIPSSFIINSRVLFNISSGIKAGEYSIILTTDSKIFYIHGWKSFVFQMALFSPSEPFCSTITYCNRLLRIILISQVSNVIFLISNLCSSEINVYFNHFNVFKFYAIFTLCWNAIMKINFMLWRGNFNLIAIILNHFHYKLLK